MPSLVVATMVCAAVLFMFLATSMSFDHWFIIPVTLCGIVIGMDAVDWFRGRIDVLDPVGIIGLLGVHFFFLAPLLHVREDYWMRYVVAPPDWRPWLGWMATLNFLGLLVYRTTRRWSTKREGEARSGTIWQIDSRRFRLVVPFALLITGVLQVAVYARYGGVLAYLQTATDLEDPRAMQGMGFIFLIAESFPLIAMMAFAVYAKDRPRFRSWRWLAFVLIAYFALALLFGGLRGSRSNTIWALFTAVGVIHFWLRPLTKKMIFAGLAILLVFMYFYGFVKGAGSDGLRAIVSNEARAELVETTGRDWHTTLLGDLGRTDVQALLLYRLTDSQFDYRLAYGRTYVGGAAIVIPRQLYPSRPIDKAKEGTEALYGRGSYIPGVLVASRVYGLAGETMLNFGPLLIPVAFGVWGLIVGRIRSLAWSWRPGDARFLILPILINLSFVILISDSDNLVFFIVKRLAVPLIVLLLVTTRQPYAIWSRSATRDLHPSRTSLEPCAITAGGFD